jgi:hypothetical protein
MTGAPLTSSNVPCSVRLTGAPEYQPADARVDEVEVREGADDAALEDDVPGVVPREVGAQDEVPEGARVAVEGGADLGHGGEAVVVLGAEGEFAEGG